MYEDTWYSFVPSEPKAQKEDIHLPKSGHRRRASLLQQPNEGDHGTPSQGGVLTSLFEDAPVAKGPPDATVARRAKSYSDFYYVVRAQHTKDCKKMKQEYREAGMVLKSVDSGLKFENQYETLEDDLLDASQEEFRLYRDQLALSERHLDGLLEDTASALKLLANLSDSFMSVESQTTAFQGQCEDLLDEQKHLRTLSDEIGMQLKYYSYLEPITRRLNAPGASSMIGDDGFVEMLTTLDSSIKFMIEHPNHREAEVYLSRYKSLHERTLNLLRVKFSKLVQGDKEKAKRNANSSEKLTITDLFLYLAPDSVGDIALLQTAMAQLRIESFKTARELQEEQRNHARFETEAQGFFLEAEPRLITNDPPLADAVRPEYRAHLSKYLETFNLMMKEYVDARYDLTPKLLQRILDDLSLKQGLSYSPTFGRDVVAAVTEVCSFENTKFIQLFAGNYEDQQQSQVLETLDLVDGRSAHFRKFIVDLCAQGFQLLRPRLASIEIDEEAELANFLNGNKYDVILENEDLFDSYIKDELDPSAFHSTDNNKHFVTWELSRLVTAHCFQRMTAIALQDIESYVATPADLAPHSSTTNLLTASADKLGVGPVVVSRTGEVGVTRETPRVRADKLLGVGLANGYPPVIKAAELFIVFSDLLYDGKMDGTPKEFAYTVIHGTCDAIVKASKQINTRHSHIDSLIFSIKNLVLIKNVVLALEIAGSHTASILDFSTMWSTFSDLRSRGSLLDPRSYYDLLKSGTLLPRVIQNVADARTELDGFLRQTINGFRLFCASKMWNQSRKAPETGHVAFKAEVIQKLQVMFPAEEQLRFQLWAAVDELVEEWKNRR